MRSARRSLPQTPVASAAADVVALYNRRDFAKTEPVGTRPFPSRPPRSTRVSTPALHQFRRIVVKVGSSLLVDRAGGRLRHAWLAALAEDLAAVMRVGDVLALVGDIGAGK